MDGDGFFILKQPGSSGSPVYTRNGDFSLNANGLLYDPSSGMAVQGYTANNNGVDVSYRNAGRHHDPNRTAGTGRSDGFGNRAEVRHEDRRRRPTSTFKTKAISIRRSGPQQAQYVQKGTTSSGNAVHDVRNDL